MRGLYHTMGVPIILRENNIQFTPEWLAHWYVYVNLREAILHKVDGHTGFLEQLVNPIRSARMLAQMWEERSVPAEIVTLSPISLNYYSSKFIIFLCKVKPTSLTNNLRAVTLYETSLSSSTPSGM